MKHRSAAFLVCALIIVTVLSGLNLTPAMGAPFLANPDGADIRSNMEPILTSVAVADEEAPVTTPTLSGAYGIGWFSSDVTVNLTAVDQMSGVKTIEYGLGLGMWQIDTGNFSISSEGSNILWFSATDWAGNRELEQSVNINIDKTVPVTSYVLAGKYIEGTSIFASSVGVILESQDVMEGVTEVRYSVDGGPFDWYSGPFIVSTQGLHYLRFNSTDLAGNWEVERTVQFTIDTIAPVTSASLLGARGTADGLWAT